jgi:UDP-GlcNAc:undecaprenyl-phosphate GlcNAc-1-phosphate transferase
MDDIGGDPGASFPANGLSGLFDSLDRLLARVGSRFGPVAALRAQGLLSAKGLVLGLLGILLLLLLAALVPRVLRRCGRVEANFRGERIPQSYGLVILLWTGAMLGATAWLFHDQRALCLTWLVGIAGFGVLGFVDDTWGTKRIKGLRGHFRAALRERTLTTGFIKAVGGAALALFLGARLSPDVPAVALLNAALIALSANAVNLLDLRPGRAGGVFLLLAFPLAGVAALSGEAGVPPLLLVMIPTLIVWGQDSRARVMMGDTGSNLLGAALGLGLCAAWDALPARLVALLLLVGLHILAERVSLTQLIAGNPLLRTLDKLTGVR